MKQFISTARRLDHLSKTALAGAVFGLAWSLLLFNQSGGLICGAGKGLLQLGEARMSRIDPRFRDLLAEVARLIAKAVEERMESVEFHEGLEEINRRAAAQYGHIISGIGVALNLSFAAIPAPGGKGGERREANLSLNFKFGGSKEDKEMGKLLRLDEQEMNQLLKQVRQERGGGERGGSAALADAEKTPRPPAETEEAAESADPRSVSQIINSIRAAARSLEPYNRRVLHQHLNKFRAFKKIVPPFLKEETLENDTLWLGEIQKLINFVQMKVETERKRKQEFLALEQAIQLAAEL